MLTDLPDDILLYLIHFLPFQSDLNSLLRANGYLYALLNPLLYRHNVKHAKCSALQWAAKHGNASTARKMLDEGAPLDAGTKDLWWAPISLAVRNGHDSVVSLFIERGLDLKCLTHRTSSCTHLSNYLLGQAILQGQESMARRLLPYRVVSKSSYNGCSECCSYPLCWAAGNGSLSLVKLLIDLKYDINAGDEGNDTPLICAAAEGRNDVVSFLIQCGANTEHEGSRGTALNAAATDGHFTVVRTLIDAGARPDPVSGQDNKSLMAVAHAAEEQHLEIARFLLSRIDTDQKIVETGDDPHLLLRAAALCGLDGIIKKLLDSGDAIVNKLKESGDSDYYGANWPAAVSLAAQLGNLESMRLLLDTNIPHIRDYIGTALETAIIANSLDKTRLLLDYGADPNTRGYSGRKALKVALGNEEIFEMLLDYGASLEPAREKGEDNILAQIIESGNIGLLEILLKRGVKLQLPQRTGTTLLKSGVRGGEKMIKFLFDNGMRILPPCNMVDQCIAMAARMGQSEMLQFLLDRGYSLGSDARRAKLLEIASDGPDGNQSATLDLLIRNGADLEARNRCGEPALWCHARGGHEKAVRLLLDKGADPLSRNQRNECLLEVAAQSGNPGVVKSLLQCVSRRGIPWTDVENAWSQASLVAKGIYPRITRELDVFYCRTMFPV